jgi:hypothetical protein
MHVSDLEGNIKVESSFRHAFRESSYLYNLIVVGARDRNILHHLIRVAESEWKCFRTEYLTQSCANCTSRFGRDDLG